MLKNSVEPLPDGRGSVSVIIVYSYLLSRDRKEAVLSSLFRHPSEACATGQAMLNLLVKIKPDRDTGFSR